MLDEFGGIVGGVAGAGELPVHDVDGAGRLVPDPVEEVGVAVGEHRRCWLGEHSRVTSVVPGVEQREHVGGGGLVGMFVELTGPDLGDPADVARCGVDAR